MVFERQVEDGADGVEGRVLEGPLPEDRREAGRDQKRVALAERYIELLGKTQDELPARERTASLDEAQMARGDLRS
jgi:hypothetical protein